MFNNEFWLIVPGAPAWSILLWFVIVSSAMHLAREQAHRAIKAMIRLLRNGLRLSSRSLELVLQRIRERNRVVLLNAGKQAAERQIVREFSRIDHLVQKDLARYPTMQRELSDLVATMNEDYEKSSATPPPPPGWTKAVKEIAAIPSTGDSTIARILGEIHKFLVREQERSLREYRKVSQSRHGLLQQMRGRWQKVEQVLQRVDKNIAGVLERSKTIDQHIQHYEEIIRGEDAAVHMLESSATTQFFISLFVLLIAIGGSMINFNLIARPMAEMVGGNTYMMGFKTSHIAALVIIFVEVAMGLFLMESMRITRLFPVIGALSDRARKRMIWATFMMLFLLASVEAGLAYMRDILAQDESALIASLVGSQGQIAETLSQRWITTAAQMGMGFILPFALTFVAIPLESFIHASRTVLGTLLALFVQFVAYVLRLVGNAVYFTGMAVLHLYDLLAFLPAAVVRSWPRGKKEGVREDATTVAEV